MIVFSERLDALLIANGFHHSGPQMGKGNTFDLPLGEAHERRLRVYHESGKVVLFCMDRQLVKQYDNESEITEEEIKAFIQLSK